MVEFNEMYAYHEAHIRQEGDDLMRSIKVKADVLASVRIKQGFSIRSLAKISHLDPVTLCRIEGNQVSPSPRTALKICKSLNKDFDDIFELVEE